MAYQSKTYSLSDEVVAAIEDARAQGLSPNKYLRQLLGIDPAKAIASDATRAAQTRAIGKASTETYRVPRGLREKGDSKR